MEKEIPEAAIKLLGKNSRAGLGYLPVSDGQAGP